MVWRRRKEGMGSCPEQEERVAYKLTLGFLAWMVGRGVVPFI
jgi:hypothetical protein